MPRLGEFAQLMDGRRRLNHGAGHGDIGPDDKLQHCVADYRAIIDVVGKVGITTSITARP